MPFYTKVLQPDETVRVIGRLHWSVYLRGLIVIVLACGVTVLALSGRLPNPDWQRYVGIAAGVSALELPVGVADLLERERSRDRNLELAAIDHGARRRELPGHQRVLAGIEQGQFDTAGAGVDDEHAHRGACPQTVCGGQVQSRTCGGSSPCSRV